MTSNASAPDAMRRRHQCYGGSNGLVAKSPERSPGQGEKRSRGLPEPASLHLGMPLEDFGGVREDVRPDREADLRARMAILAG